MCIVTTLTINAQSLPRLTWKDAPVQPLLFSGTFRPFHSCYLFSFFRGLGENRMVLRAPWDTGHSRHCQMTNAFTKMRKVRWTFELLKSHEEWVCPTGRELRPFSTLFYRITRRYLFSPYSRNYLYDCPLLENISIKQQIGVRLFAGIAA